MENLLALHSVSTGYSVREVKPIKSGKILRMSGGWLQYVFLYDFCTFFIHIKSTVQFMLHKFYINRILNLLLVAMVAHVLFISIVIHPPILYFLQFLFVLTFSFPLVNKKANFIFFNF